MANGFGSFYVGGSGLASAQNALNVTANNLANVDTKGYVREQVRFSDKSYDVLKKPTTGRNMQQRGLGVSISDVAHARDIFLDKAYRQESGRENFYQSLYNVNEYVQDILQEMNGKEFKEGIQDLWQAFQEYAKDPSNSTNQSLVIQKSDLLLSRSSAVYSDLQSYQSNLNLQIQQSINRVNEIGNRIHELNLHVQKVESAGVETAMTARDERDALIDELAKYFKIEVKEDFTGSVTVKIEGSSFVEENRCNNIALEMERGSGFYTPYWPHLTTQSSFSPVFSDVALPPTLTERLGNKQTTNIATELNNDIGSIKALIVARGSEYGNFSYMSEENYANVADCIVMETQSQISYLVRNIVKEMNDIFCPNKEITASDGTKYKVLDMEKCSVGADKQLPPQELFVREGYPRYTKTTIDGTDYYVYNDETSANISSWYNLGNISVNPDLKVEVTKLPSFSIDGKVNYELGDLISAAWEYNGMKINPSDTSPCTFEGFYNKMVGNLGTTGSIYYSSADTMNATVSSIDNQRQQVMGVSSDEELTNMIKYQSAYNASSRYITVISEMTELIVTGLI